MGNLLAKANKQDNCHTGESAADVNEPPSLYVDVEMWVKEGDSIEMILHSPSSKQSVF